MAKPESGEAEATDTAARAAPKRRQSGAAKKKGSKEEEEEGEEKEGADEGETTKREGGEAPADEGQGITAEGSGEAGGSGPAHDKESSGHGKGKAAAAVDAEEDEGKPSTKKGKMEAKESDPTTYILGQRFTHPHKELFPGVTKMDLAQYYSDVSDFMLPFLRDRPVTLLRGSHGPGSKNFFQKHPVHGYPDKMKLVQVEEKSGHKDTYMEVNDLHAIESAIQMDTLEFHPWISKYIPGQPEHATFLMFDLDAGPSTTFDTLSFVAHTLRDTLQTFGLKSYPLLTGSLGLHVTVPLSEPLRSFDDVHTFAKFLAEQLAKKHPDKITSHRNQDRTHRVFLDYIRNFRGATSICPYSTRANDKATVAVPIAWEELPEHTMPNQYNIHTVRKRLEKLRTSGADPWKDIFSCKQALTPHAMQAVLHDLP